MGALAAPSLAGTREYLTSRENETSAETAFTSSCLCVCKAVESLHRWQREGRISHTDMEVRKLEALRMEGRITEAEHGRRRIEVSADGGGYYRWDWFRFRQYLLSIVFTDIQVRHSCVVLLMERCRQPVKCDGAVASRGLKVVAPVGASRTLSPFSPLRPLSHLHQGSTRLWERFGGKFKGIIDMHHRVLRDVLRRHHGYEVKTEGDAFMIVFTRPADAVLFGEEPSRNLRTKDSHLPTEDSRVCLVVGAVPSFLPK